MHRSRGGNGLGRIQGVGVEVGAGRRWGGGIQGRRCRRVGRVWVTVEGDMDGRGKEEGIDDYHLWAEEEGVIRLDPLLQVG